MIFTAMYEFYIRRDVCSLFLGLFFIKICFEILRTEVGIVGAERDKVDGRLDLGR